MSEFSSDLVARRGYQLFLRLEIARSSKSAERKHYKGGEHIALVGDTGVELKLVLSGKIAWSSPRSRRCQSALAQIA